MVYFTLNQHPAWQLLHSFYLEIVLRFAIHTQTQTRREATLLFQGDPFSLIKSHTKNEQSMHALTKNKICLHKKRESSTYFQASIWMEFNPKADEYHQFLLLLWLENRKNSS